jgi:hypothetical protein
VSSLRTFLQRYVSVLDPGTTVGLLAGYGRLGELQHYARCRGDWEGLLEYLLQRGEVGGARVWLCVCVVGWWFLNACMLLS